MDPLYELLAPYFDKPEPPSTSFPTSSSSNASVGSYLTRISTLSIPELTSTEPASLLQSAQSHLRNLQALSKRSHKAVISSASHLGDLTTILHTFETKSTELRDAFPDLEASASEFAAKYDRSTENAVLDRRKRAMLLSQNVDRVTDVLDLPSLLSSTVSAAQTLNNTTTSTAATSYASALDLHAHIKRLNALYPNSQVVGTISKQAEEEIQNLTTILITSLQAPSLKLAGAMRTIGWLRRVAPDLASDGNGLLPSEATSTRTINLSSPKASADGALGSLFLVCRLHTLHITLRALEPLRDLADQESTRRKQGTNGKLLKQQVSASALGSQSERYFKRYIEIFREQSFNIISMYKSIFPSGLPTADVDDAAEKDEDAVLSAPSPLSSFALHLVDMLTATLREYIPNITDRQARESLLTQVLYCAGSLGRLGADFSLVLALLEDEIRAEWSNEGREVAMGDGDPGWVDVMRKHRIQTSRLEVLARGVGSGRTKSVDAQSPSALSSG